MRASLRRISIISDEYALVTSCSASESIEVNSHSEAAEAAASTAPAPLNEARLLTTTSTGYFHCMNRVQPAVH